jgi:hypothetical protein
MDERWWVDRRREGYGQIEYVIFPTQFPETLGEGERGAERTNKTDFGLGPKNVLSNYL